MKVNLTVSQLCELVEEWENTTKDDLTFEDLEGINQGLKDIEEGRTFTFEDFKQEIEKEFINCKNCGCKLTKQTTCECNCHE